PPLPSGSRIAGFSPRPLPRSRGRAPTSLPCSRRSISRGDGPSSCGFHRRSRREPARSLRLPVLVETAAGLAPQPARQDPPPQQRRRREALLAIFVEHDLGDRVGGV